MRVVPPPDRRIGSLVAGRFRVERLLGEGEMSRVYIAEQVSMERRVALKVLHDDLVRDPTAPGRFRREVEAVTRLRSPHAIVFYDFGRTEDGSLFIAMELLEGETLRERLDRDRTLAPTEVATIVRQVCACLGEAHAANLIHRDLKPENVFLCAGPGAPFVKVLDFGLAKFLASHRGDGQKLTAPKTTVGTPAYLAPEMAVAGRRRDARADLYALGVMTFEMLVGERPFEAKSPYEMMRAHVYDPPPVPSQRRPGLPPGVDGFLAVALAKDPDERVQSAESFARVLEATLK